MIHAKPKRGFIKPTPKHIIEAAPPFVPNTWPVALGVCLQPNKLSDWYNDTIGDCVTAEEAFAKCCDLKNGIFLDPDTVKNWANNNGFGDGANIGDVLSRMQQSGIALPSPWGNVIGDDGPAYTIAYGEWPGTKENEYNWGIMSHAIWEKQAPLKLGVASDILWTACMNHGFKDGWFVYKIENNYNYYDYQDHCISVSGYGQLEWLAGIYGVDVPHEIDSSHWGYAIFSWGTIGFIDRESLANLTGEAWIRVPTTVLVGEPNPPLPPSQCKLHVLPRPRKPPHEDDA